MQTKPPESRDSGRLLAVLGTTFGISITIGNTAGIGILRSPSAVATEIPSVWGYLAIWVLGGFYALLVALAYAKLATRTGRSGGPYTWLRTVLGDSVAFAIGWIDWIAVCGVLAVAAAVLGEYAVGLAPEFRAPEVIALIIIVAITIVQSIGVRAAAWFQYASVVLKIAALGLFIGMCVYFGTRDFASSAFVTDADGSIVSAVMVALVAVMVTMHGAGAATYFAGEMRDGGRSLRRSVAIGVTVLVGMYLLVNVAILLVVPLPTIAGQVVALDVVSDRLFGESGATLARMLVVLALVSAVNAAAMIGPRILHALGEDGAFFRATAEVNRRGTPELGLLLTSAVAGGLVVLHSQEWLMGCVAVIFAIAAAASFVAVLRLEDGSTATRAGALAGLVASLVILGAIAFSEPGAIARTAALGLIGLLARVVFRQRRVASA